MKDFKITTIHPTVYFVTGQPMVGKTAFCEQMNFHNVVTMLSESIDLHKARKTFRNGEDIFVDVDAKNEYDLIHMIPRLIHLFKGVGYERFREIKLCGVLTYGVGSK